MPWVPTNRAAAVLDVSERTIYRRIKSGDLKSMRDKGQVLVEVDTIDPVKVVADGVDKLSQAAQATAIQRHEDSEHVARMLDTMSDLIRHERQNARRARVGTLTATLAAIALIVVTAQIGIVYHESELGRIDQVGTMQRNLDRLGTDKAGLETRADELQRQVVETATAAEQAVRDRDRVEKKSERLVGDLTEVTAQRDALEVELNELRCELEASDLEDASGPDATHTASVAAIK